MNTQDLPGNQPANFLKEYIPDDMLAHAGVFSPDMNQYFLTLSDRQFENFTVQVITYEDDNWSAPKNAFFNTDYNEHGVHFTSDGQWLYFSSTRPINVRKVPDTWHIWRCKKTRIGWSEPVLIDIPGMESNMVSHPSITTNGKMYFHAANLDYSNMGIYECQITAKTVSKATKVNLTDGFNRYACTPFISPDESYLLFAEIGTEEELFISYKTDAGTWGTPKNLGININKGNLGNPFVSPDQKLLFFAAIDGGNTETNDHWVIKWVATEEVLN